VRLSRHAAAPLWPSTTSCLTTAHAIARTRTGYAFAELPTEIQDAILGLIATRDLTTRKLDLALWLEDLHITAAAAL
jgi:hypothetical protein